MFRIDNQNKITAKPQEPAAQEEIPALANSDREAAKEDVFGAIDYYKANDGVLDGFEKQIIWGSIGDYTDPLSLKTFDVSSFSDTELLGILLNDRKPQDPDISQIRRIIAERFATPWLAFLKEYPDEAPPFSIEPLYTLLRLPHYQTNDFELYNYIQDVKKEMHDLARKCFAKAKGNLDAAEEGSSEEFNSRYDMESFVALAWLTLKLDNPQVFSDNDIRVLSQNLTEVIGNDGVLDIMGYLNFQEIPLPITSQLAAASLIDRDKIRSYLQEKSIFGLDTFFSELNKTKVRDVSLYLLQEDYSGIENNHPDFNDNRLELIPLDNATDGLNYYAFYQLQGARMLGLAFGKQTGLLPDETVRCIFSWPKKDYLPETTDHPRKRDVDYNLRTLDAATVDLGYLIEQQENSKDPIVACLPKVLERESMSNLFRNDQEIKIYQDYLGSYRKMLERAVCAGIILVFPAGSGGSNGENILANPVNNGEDPFTLRNQLVVISTYNPGLDLTSGQDDFLGPRSGGGEENTPFVAFVPSLGFATSQPNHFYASTFPVMKDYLAQDPFMTLGGSVVIASLITKMFELDANLKTGEDINKILKETGRAIEGRPEGRAVIPRALLTSLKGLVSTFLGLQVCGNAHSLLAFSARTHVNGWDRSNPFADSKPKH